MTLDNFIDKNGLRATARLFGRTAPWVNNRRNAGYIINMDEHGTVLELVGPLSREIVKPAQTAPDSALGA